MKAANDNKKPVRREMFGPWVNTQEWAVQIGSRFFCNWTVCKNGHVSKHSARLRDSGGTHTAEDIAELLRLQKYKCVECGASIRKRVNRHVDHIMPIALGGRNDKSNLQVLCAFCNLSKNDLHPLEFAKRKGRLV